ncbi:hypothetical protein [Longimicrobium sp.]|uniref:hypothetical protein n=1 Tax=Longimicrobium sp. TaxID=2029185 RepID=UPI002E306E57|nr:hypothetical protein [Longimicrobium sp.]HEX6038229.1 hypothetical protein [Longimicrobium sp.]
MFNEYPADAPKGPSAYDPKVRRRNVITAFLVLLFVLVLMAIPATYRKFQQREAVYDTHAAAVQAQAVENGDIPTFVPPTATEIHTRRNRQTDQRFVRFNFQPAEVPALTRGMRRVEGEEALKRVSVPSPGWSRWWLITSRTLTGGQGEYLEVYHIPSGPDRGYLALDPRTRHGYFWSR